MAPPTSSNYLLISLTLLGIAFLYYILFMLDYFTLNALDSSFLLAALFGSFWLYNEHLLKPLGWRDSLPWLLAFGLVALFVLILTANIINPYRFLLISLALWVVGFAHITLAVFLQPNERNLLINKLCLYLSLPIYIIMSGYFLKKSGINHPLVMDEYLMAADGALGFYPSLLIGQLTSIFPIWLLDFIKITYIALPFIFLYIYCRLQSLYNKASDDLILEFLLIGVVGFTLYNLIPACGSAFAFFGYWPEKLPAYFNPLQPKLIYCTNLVPRNCLPSLHTAWIICLIRRALLCEPFTKILTIIFAVGTFFGMFFVGAHYLIDIIIGLIFASLLASMTPMLLLQSNRQYFFIFLFTLFVFCGWYWLILFHLNLLYLAPYLSWLFFIFSILFSLVMERRLFVLGKANYLAQ